MKKQELKETLEITEAIITIFVSIIALWGIFKAWDNDLFHKTKDIIEHHHKDIIQNNNNCSNK